MNVLKFLIIIVLVAAKTERISSVSTSTTVDPSTTASTSEEPSTESSTAPGTTTSAEPSTASSSIAEPTSTAKPAPACVVPQPQCYRNINGICRTFATKCDAQNGNCAMSNSALKWQVTNSGDCKKRELNQLKTCWLDCKKFTSTTCTGKSVCASSYSMQKIRHFSSLCAMKKVSCNDPALKDWRITNMSACKGLKPNAPAVPYPVSQ